METGNPGTVFLAPLWHDAEIPNEIAWNYPKLRAFWDASPETWDFWQKWYRGMFEGRPLDWDLQREVALIPDEDWEKGPEHIAEKIDVIRKRFELEKRIEELERARDQVVVAEARLGIGGNNPPEEL